MKIEPDVYRKFTRIKYDRHVNLEFVSDKYENCRIKDLSVSGMFVMGDFQKLSNDYCIVNLVQKGVSTGLSLHALAQVARKNDEGVAVEFTSMPFDSYMFLQIALLNESEDPFVVEKILAEDCPFEVTEHLLTSSKKDDTPQ